ncbi:MAG: FGGY-family carbohydrate kinase, partial [Cyanobium sp.]
MAGLVNHREAGQANRPSSVVGKDADRIGTPELALTAAGAGRAAHDGAPQSITAAIDPGAGPPPALLLRHQADWLMGWLLGDMRWGEEGNNLRLGWDLQRQAWSGTIAAQSWAVALPVIRPSGCTLGTLNPAVAALLGLSETCQVVAGSTDANAGVLAADPQEGDGVTVLGTTLVLKQFVEAPIRAPGLSCHRVGGRWLLGGASNAGAGILRRFFDDAQIAELSRQIDPRRASGLDLLPLPARGERFPVDDPLLEPRLEPRPVSDARYLQALLEGLTELERLGWQRFAELGAPPVRRVLTLGGGARNPQWRMLRQKALGVPVLQRADCSAALGMARLALHGTGRMETSE